MLPNFTEHGLLPEGIHECSLEDAHNRFCYNDHRKRIWDGLGVTLKLMQQDGLAGGCLLIDGSFVTDKHIPSDVEVLFDVTSITDEQLLYRAYRFFFDHHNQLKTNYMVDWYANLPGAPNDFSLFFQYVGEKTAQIKGISPKDLKGLLKVESWETV